MKRNSPCSIMFALRIAVFLGYYGLLVSAQACVDSSGDICRFYITSCNSPFPFFRDFLEKNCKKTCKHCRDTGPTWGLWTTYTNCDVTCGSGTQTRSRVCAGATNQNRCQGSATGSRPCQNEPCPIWGNWYTTGECSRSCGGGIQREMRDCTQGNCVGDTTRNILRCNEQECPVGQGTFSDCSANCGIGYQSRETSCGNQCSRVEHQVCRTASDCRCECPLCEDERQYNAFCTVRVAPDRPAWCGRPAVQNACRKSCGLCGNCNCNEGWGDWSEWTFCSVTCGAGTRVRFRDCSVLAGCSGGTYFMTEPCQREPCAGGGFRWGEWQGSCSVTCGIGALVETRVCEFGNCQGQDRRERPCSNDACPVWGSWELGDCSVTCGSGVRMDRRQCVNGPRCELENGVGSTRTLDCTGRECPYWGAWTFGQCSVTCGGGERTDTRVCENGPGCQPENAVTDSRVETCHDNTCPDWTTWSEGKCSEDCGGGRRTDTRRCRNGNSCDGDPTRMVDCNVQACPEWSVWSDSGTCSKTCGPGMIEQTRFCINGPGCDGQESQRVDCNQGECNNPVWGPWQRDGDCDVTCGGGNRRERRECIDGPGCGTQNTRMVPCGERPCPIWGDFETGECSATCGDGTRIDTRPCINGPGCLPENEGSRERNCNLGACPVWGEWVMGKCSVTCGDGTRVDTRPCLNGPGCLPQNGGRREEDCNAGACPVWGEWVMGECSVTCADGTRMDTRPCLNGPGCLPEDGGSRERDCNSGACPVWGEWEMGECSVTCGEGTRMDTRPCLNGPNCLPQNGGRRERDCNPRDCPVWGPWMNGNCPVTCGGGRRTDTRECMNGPNCLPTNGGSREVDCNTDTCPEWGDWEMGECPVDCGGGMRTDTRVCMNGATCTGSATRTVPCGTDDCPMWGPWQLGSCSVTCGEGTRTDRRDCLNGPGCMPLNENTREVSCSEDPCADSALGQWSRWTDWTSCGNRCGRSERRRTRTCPNEKVCIGEDADEDSCPVGDVCECTCPDDPDCTNSFEPYCTNTVSLALCRTNGWYPDNCRKTCKVCGTCAPCGTWSDWRPWSGCSATCGPGVRSRSRTCPSGRTCNGPDAGTKACVLADCGPQWTEWGSWTDCSRPCAGGRRSRTRQCEISRVGACGNSANARGEEDCNILSCDETWRPWSQWGSCSRTCGPGHHQRTRTCRGRSCAGGSTDRRGCNNGVCVVYNRWSACSRSCGRGTQTKQDFRDGPISYRDCISSNCPDATCSNQLRQRYGSRGFECCDHSGITGRSCGISVNPGRIIGGRNAEVRRWPWTVLIRPGSEAICGGVLISPYLVLTAGHCLYDIPTSGIDILLGAHTFGDSSPHVQRRVPKKTYVHPDYDFPAHDIGLIQLKEPAIVGGDYVRTLCLPKGETVPDDLSCIATGWGLVRSFSNDIPDVLQEVELRTLPFQVCKNGYSNTNARSKIKEETMLCAGRISGGVDTCNGDSGGPLMCQRCSNCQWFVAGLTSFGDANCATAGKPGVYTRVSRYSAYINNVIQAVYDDLSVTERVGFAQDLNLATGNYESCT